MYPCKWYCSLLQQTDYLYEFIFRENDFLREARHLIQCGIRVSVLAILAPFLVSTLNKLGIGILPSRSLQFFSKFIDESLMMRSNEKTPLSSIKAKDRNTTAIERNSFIQTLAGLKKASDTFPLNCQNRKMLSDSEIQVLVHVKQDLQLTASVFVNND